MRHYCLSTKVIIITEKLKIISHMDFEKSPFGKMQLWIVEHFFHHKKVTVLMNHNIWKNRMLWFIIAGTF